MLMTSKPPERLPGPNSGSLRRKIPRSTRQACDACSLRKVQCDGGLPCRRCVAYSFKCTFLKSRGKPGPKGPRRKTAEAIETLQSKVSPNQAQAEENMSESWAAPKEIYSRLEQPFDDNQVQGLSKQGNIDWTKAYEGSNSLDETQSSGHSRIHPSCIAHHLSKYEFRAYSIWPCFDTKSLISQLLADPDDVETYGLATALCATFITQFQASTARTPLDEGPSVSPSMFEAECRRARSLYDHRERMTIISLLTSFFLHVYAANIGKKSTTSILLNEAVTMAHIIGLHKRSYYDNLDEDQQQYCLRVYWLLFISERAHSFQQEIPTTLQRASDLPPLIFRPDGSISVNFIHLCALFNSLDEAVNANSREAIAVAQKQLNQRYLAVTGEDNEVQRADIFLTQQWMRVFLWQYSLSLTNLFSDHESEEFSLSFPAQVAKTALGFVSSLSRESLEAHGPGMGSSAITETKLFEITNSLADVMICAPSLMGGGQAGLGPRDVVHELCKLLVNFRGGNPAVIAILRDKLVSSGLMETGPRRFIKYQELEEDQSHYDNSLL